MSESTLPVLKANYTVHPCRLEDLDAVLALINAYEMQTLGETEATRDGILTDWQRPGFDLAKNQQVVIAEQTKLVGWVQIDSAEKMIQYVDIVVAPDYQN